MKTSQEDFADKAKVQQGVKEAKKLWRQDKKTVAKTTSRTKNDARSAFLIFPRIFAAPKSRNEREKKMLCVPQSEGAIDSTDRSYVTVSKIYTLIESLIRIFQIKIWI